VTVPDYVADLLQSALGTAFRGTKLGTDSSDGSGPRIPNTVTPSIVRAFILKALKDEEALGHIINVDAHTAQLVVVADTSTPGRLLADIPVVPAPGFHQFGANCRQLTQ
jgi:phage tail sheath gpL-like